jgi:hypothetical protein
MAKVLMFGAQCLEKEPRDRCSLKRHLLRKIVQIFLTEFIALLEEN